MTLVRFLGILSIFFLMMKPLSSQDQNQDDLTVEELDNDEVTVASYTKFSTRQAPGVVTLITGDEIRDMGARDLIDVLNLVPGFNFGTDVGGIVGIATRGNWSHEGKVLLLLDGQEFNEILYSNTVFGQHFDLSQIERIEVSRGPSSTIYGGFAELGVISITTKNGRDLKGINIAGTYGHYGTSTSRRSVSAFVGNNKQDFVYSSSIYIGDGIRSDDRYTDIYGTQASGKKYTRINSRLVNTGLQIGNLSLRAIYDGYNLNAPYYYDVVTAPDMISNVNFYGIYGEAKYEWRANKYLVVVPKINYKRGTPWEGTGANGTEHPAGRYEKLAQRFVSSVTADYSMGGTTVVVGVESQFDKATIKHNDVDPLFYNGKKNLALNNVGAFGQIYYTSPVGLIFIGNRLDRHSSSGFASSPRAGLTKIMGDLHFKLLYSKAFRSPTIENINTNQSIKPEKSTVAEVEVGYRFTREMTASLNLYNIRISDPIVYYALDEENYGYVNHKRTGTRGVEFQYLFRRPGCFFAANYAFYTSRGLNRVSTYNVPGHPESLLGWPSHKVNLYGSVSVSRVLTFSPTLSIVSRKYAITQYDETNETPHYSSKPAKIFFNLYLERRNAILDGLDVGLGVFDVFDRSEDFVQPYDSYTAPLSGGGREILLKLKYTFHFGKS